MAKQKPPKTTKTTIRLWARRQKGGWIFWRESLLEALRAGQVVEIGGIRLGTFHLSRMVRNTPHQDYLVKVTGKRFDLETVARVFRVGRDGFRHCQFRKPTTDFSHFCLYDGAHVPPRAGSVIVIKPKIYGKRSWKNCLKIEFSGLPRSVD